MSFSALQVNEAWFRTRIDEFIASPDNTLGNSQGDRAFERPLLGFASGADSLFDFFRKDIGDFYLTPMDAFEKVFPGSGCSSRELTVVSWILPHIPQTREDNRKEKHFPSERWALGKYSGLQVNIRLQKYLVENLGKLQIQAMIPCSPPHWSEKISGKYSYASSWSERHAAHAAGLGTFGLCDGLITPLGKAMRCGSIIARMEIPPTPRPYHSHTEYCLYLNRGTCGICMSRCPVGAISPEGHDKEKCKAHVDGDCVDYSKRHFHIDVNVCGLCQTRVPCESRIPGYQ